MTLTDEKSPDEKIDNDQSVFIWLDILGWANAVEDDLKFEELAKLLTEFQSSFSHVDGCVKSKIISDGLILQISGLRNEIDYKNLTEIFNAIGKKQFDFIYKNKQFIRGGISVGKVHKTNQNDKNETFVSNGLARAVKKESKHVHWPIIGTDSETIEKIRKIYSINNDEETFGLKQCFNNDGQDVFFIDYIPKTNPPEFVNLIKSKIIEFRAPLDRKIRNKYIWLLRHYLQKFPNEEIPDFLRGIII